MFAPRMSRKRLHRAFTIVELIVVIGIIGLLIGLLLPSLRSMRTAGRMSEEMSTARQVMVGYLNYAAIHNDRVMPGYASGFRAEGLDGQRLGSPAADRYPWRLAPYIGDSVQGLFATRMQSYYDQLESEQDYYAMSLYPSLGINAAFVGGEEAPWCVLNPDPNQESPFQHQLWGRFWVSRLSDVPVPERLIVFASARGPGDFANGPGGVVDGYFKIESPHFIGAENGRWADSFHDANQPGEFGFLDLRYNDEVVAAMIDGHVEPLNEAQLRDMRRWAPRADGPEWTPEQIIE